MCFNSDLRRYLDWKKIVKNLYNIAVMTEVIRVKGAREHNLKNVDIEIPRDQLVVITGLSGSGKSSLAFDTIYAEGQRRYMESLNSYARQFWGRWISLMLIRLKGLAQRFQLTRSRLAATRVRPWLQLPKLYDYS